jgi:hypothetical protein
MRADQARLRRERLAQAFEGLPVETRASIERDAQERARARFSKFLVHESTVQAYAITIREDLTEEMLGEI